MFNSVITALTGHCGKLYSYLLCKSLDADLGTKNEISVSQCVGRHLGCQNSVARPG